MNTERRRQSNTVSGRMRKYTVLVKKRMGSLLSFRSTELFIR